MTNERARANSDTRPGCRPASMKTLIDDLQGDVVELRGLVEVLYNHLWQNDSLTDGNAFNRGVWAQISALERLLAIIDDQTQVIWNEHLRLEKERKNKVDPKCPENT